MKNKTAVLPGKIVTVNNNDEILNNHAVIINDGTIENILPAEKFNQSGFEG